MKSKDAIESTFGGPLEWDSNDSRRVCQVRKRVADIGLKDETEWPRLQDELATAMAKLEKAIRPHLTKLTVGRRGSGSERIPVMGGDDDAGVAKE
jgi:hypothetical protein